MTTDGRNAPPLSLPADTRLGLPNCGLVALAVAARTTYMDAEDWYRRRVRPRGNWKGRTYHKHYGAYLTACNVWYVYRQYERGEQMTVQAHARELKADTTYMIRVNGHMLVYRNGYTIDQSGVRPVANCPYRRCFVKNTWEVLTW